MDSLGYVPEIHSRQNTAQQNVARQSRQSFPMPSLAQLTKLLTIDPADTFVLYGLAQEHARLGDHAAAITWYDKCLAIDPLYCYAYFHKARSQQALGDLPAASDTVRKGIDAARKAQDGKALSELQGLLVELD
jgi:tetratricopeptide (TPR) repeat protein